MTNYLDVLACSGPNTQEKIRMAIAWSYTNAALAFVLTILIAFSALRLARFSLPLKLCIAFLIAHPAWWVNPWGGDCGDGMFMGSLLFSLGFIALYTWQRFLAKD